MNGNMPVVKGKVGEFTVNALRDTGCSGMVVQESFVKEHQYAGQYSYMLLIDNSIRKVPLAKINVDTPYIKGEVEAQVLPEVIYDLVIGNVAGARPPGEPDPSWQEACAVTNQGPGKERCSTLETTESFSGSEWIGGGEERAY